ncbi:MAG: hypothetical protein COT55_02745 [Candidatus Diapherotrites archaeon CG09_land_8_20_14_0_10_32_12]|nr:MAG: hypothetical protein COT55_02745 [Candidatus Diapherotrites archaeon CG09_land_8_20_14_0_10_32_12]
MATMTLSIPTDLKSKMDLFCEINWSAVAREAFVGKIKDLEFIKQFKAKSNFTEEDAIKLGRDLNKQLSKRRSI